MRRPCEPQAEDRRRRGSGNGWGRKLGLHIQAVAFQGGVLRAAPSSLHLPKPVASARVPAPVVPVLVQGLRG
jgi:hypothetical protein